MFLGAARRAGSPTLGAGRSRAHPGISAVIAGRDGDAFAATAQTTLTDGIAEAYRNGARPDRSDGGRTRSCAGQSGVRPS
jgi:NADP-dependent aldehyde dehydrogenase